MKKTIVFLLCFLLLLGGCAPQPPSTDQTAGGSAQNTDLTEPSTTQDAAQQPSYVNDFVPGGEGAGVAVSCMSFNVLAYDTHGIGYADPAERAPLVARFIREQNCDIVGLQEVSEIYGYDWVTTLKTALGDIYESRILLEEEDCAYSYMEIGAGLMILYRKDRFELLDSGCCEYYEDYNRYYQWVKLKDSKSGRELFVTNTHFSIDPSWSDDVNAGNLIRTSEAQELSDFWENHVKDTPLFATGDYNCYEFDDPHVLELQTSIYQPSSSVATEIEGGSSIDFVYLNTLSMNCTRYVKTEKSYTDANGESLEMSDHYPVIAYAEYQ